MDGQAGKRRDWVAMRRDAETGVETIRAHFQGHAYDLHDHDELLVGVTEQGVQAFRCRRRLHTSTPGRVILIEPGEAHDGHSPGDDGFTYAMLYLPVPLLAARADALRSLMPRPPALGFRDTLADDPRLAAAIGGAFLALHGREGRLARDLALDRLAARLAGHVAPLGALSGPPAGALRDRPDRAAVRARDLLHARMGEDVGLDDLAAASGVDRFRLNRAFRAAFGLSPHAYLVRLRLRAARRRLAAGEAPALVAAEVGFADQSHLGRWFRRAYGLTPAAYRDLAGRDIAGRDIVGCDPAARDLCTNVPDRSGRHRA
ncbi:AraC family transcriptional regulator [Azospirillum picis]|uniref:AraC-like DNA-binding protein n=1 Tax=Azospirillum picis TaxID=488438 RepID=A0ABU0MK59_9PROT|nr:AraC family transcriptional regulator [Azospirillum picis]MBP2299902.1 AraC-like DNA-binding protein [Azospirillum picis]MDQ0533860.1 AraC-like DNA-binding protein [Azospirillum picis]